MNYNTIAERLFKRDKIVILDGATGTEIYRRRVRSDPNLPWAVNGLVHAPDVVRKIHYDYFMSGANVVTANCFYTTGYALRRFSGFQNDAIPRMARSLTYLGVLLCRDAQQKAKEQGVDQPTCVAGNVTPLEAEDPYDPKTVLLKGLAMAEHSEKIQNLLGAGVDMILIETMTTLYEASIVLEAYDEVGIKTPFWISFSCNNDGVLYGGESMKEVVDLVESYSPNALLVNCTPPQGVTKALTQLVRLASIPLGAYANIEMPVYPGSNTWQRRPEISPQIYADYCRHWWTLGARIIGGCCGTTPQDIAEVVRVFRDKR